MRRGALKVWRGGFAAGAILAAAVPAARAQAPISTAPPTIAPPSPLSQSPVPEAPKPKDQCGAADLADLVGKPHTEIPVPVDPSHRRVACTTCRPPEDVDPTRLNILFDAATGIVKSVTCG